MPKLSGAWLIGIETAPLQAPGHSLAPTIPTVVLQPSNLSIAMGQTGEHRPINVICYNLVSALI